MEQKNDLIQQIKSRFTSRILKVSAFGKQGVPMLWIDGNSLRVLAQHLVQEGYFHCENLAVIELEDALVFTYFLRNDEDAQIVLRMTHLIPSVGSSSDAYVKAQSAIEFWPSVGGQESEYSELFGIRFTPEQQQKRDWTLGVLPEGWIGFPLRKNYVFPTEFFDLLHMRALGQSEADDYKDYSDTLPIGGDS